ncbi:MAG: DUF2804 family protein [Deltaproteobacteria bacterium]|nr:DUF2804 family protein [Deltaproteobacteria bacterium]
MVSRFHQPYGTFSGSLRAPGGERVELGDIYGVAEQHYPRWSPPISCNRSRHSRASNDGSPSRPRSRLTSSARLLTYRSTLRAGPAGALALTAA